MPVRILAFSDFHLSRSRVPALLEAAREADLVIGAGDFCNHRQGLDEAMELFWTLESKAVYVPGNAESASELRKATGATVLHGEGTQKAGLSIFGLGYAVPETPFGDWSCDLSEQMAADKLSGCQSADVMVFHSPPKGIADQTSAGRSVGSTAIRDAIARVQPRLAFCGHIHDSWGAEGLIGSTSVHNLGPTPNLFTL